MAEEPLLRLRGVSKSFGAVHAIADIDLDVVAGQVTALAGDNGAGKSWEPMLDPCATRAGLSRRRPDAPARCGVEWSGPVRPEPSSG